MTARHKTILTRPSDREMVFTRSFDAPRTLVWQAWTDPAQLARWWGPNGFSITTHERSMQVGGVWAFTMHGPDGRDYPNRVVFLEVNAPERLVYKHVGEGDDAPILFQTTVTMVESGGVTTLTMRAEMPTAASLEYVIKNHQADEGGQQTIGRLGEHVAMLTSDRPEFLVTRIFDAPRDLVWRAWTDPAMVAKWFGPKGSVMRVLGMDVRPSGIWHSHIRMPDGVDMWAKFVFEEVAAPKRLVWKHAFSNAAGDLIRHPMATDWPLLMLTAVTFEELGGRTKVIVSMVPFEATAAESAIFAESLPGMNTGWGGSFEQLDAFLAGVKAGAGASR